MKGIAMDNDANLIRKAIEAASGAYARYSNFKVGAALLCEDGVIVTGCNIENGSYGLSMCAERVAVFKAVSEGRRDFKAIAIVGGRDVPAYPCGACRQVLSEFCKPEIPVFCATLDGKNVERFTLEELLPKNFIL